VTKSPARNAAIGALIRRSGREEREEVSVRVAGGRVAQREPQRGHVEMDLLETLEKVEAKNALGTDERDPQTNAQTQICDKPARNHRQY